MCVVTRFVFRRPAGQGNASSANAAAVAADDVLAALAAAALGIIDRAQGQQQQQEQQQGGDSGRCGCGVAACSCSAAGKGCACSDCASSSAAAASAGKGTKGGGAGGGPGAAAVSGGLLGMSERALELRRRLVGFMEQHVYPAEEVLEAHAMGPQVGRGACRAHRGDRCPPLLPARHANPPWRGGAEGRDNMVLQGA